MQEWTLWLHIHAPLSEDIKTKRVFIKQVYIIIDLLPELHHCRIVRRLRCRVDTEFSVVLAGHVRSRQLHTTICCVLNHSTLLCFYILRCPFKPTDLTELPKRYSEVESSLNRLELILSPINPHRPVFQSLLQVVHGSTEAKEESR